MPLRQHDHAARSASLPMKTAAADDARPNNLTLSIERLLPVALQTLAGPANRNDRTFSGTGSPSTRFVVPRPTSGQMPHGLLGSGLLRNQGCITDRSTVFQRNAAAPPAMPPTIFS